MARFRRFDIQMDGSRALLVVCHVSITHLTRNHTPKDVFSLFLYERAFSVWTVNPPGERGIILFEPHATCRAVTNWRKFTMMMNALPDIALTGVSDWQQAQTLIVNFHHKIFPTKTIVPFGGTVYPADLVAKTARLERGNARQRQALEDGERRLRELVAENARNVQAATTQALSDDEVRAIERDAEKLLASLTAKQAVIDRLEASNAQ